MKKWKYSNEFKPISCKGYLVKIKKFDTRVIVNPENNTFTHISKNGVRENLKEIAEDRTYFRTKEDNFKGMYVGTKCVVVSAQLSRTIDNSGWQTYRKEPQHIVKCAIVYFAPNRKHLVPLDMIEEEV